MTEDVSTKRLNALAGILFLLLGAVLCALIFVDRWTSMDVGLPGIWYRSRNFHVALCVCCFVLGWWAHRNAGSEIHGQDATGPIFRTVRMFTKPECQLCDRALDVIQIYSDNLPHVELVDISGNATLEAEYGESIPVVEIDGRIRFRGHVSAELLHRLIVAQRRLIDSRSAADRPKETHSQGPTPS